MFTRSTLCAAAFVYPISNLEISNSRWTSVQTTLASFASHRREEERMLSAANVVGSAPRDYDLLGGGSDVLDLALLAARSSAAAKRVAGSTPLDDVDERSLDALADLLDTSATALEFFGNPGQGGSPPSGALAARVDVAIDVVLHQMPGHADTASLAAKLRSWAGEVRSVVVDHDPTEAARLADFLSVLASSVLRVTGHPGETTTRL